MMVRKRTKFKLLTAILCGLLGLTLLPGLSNNASAAETYPAPVMDSAKLENGNYILNWSLPSNPTGTPAGGYDLFIDGKDTGGTWRTTGTSRTITGLDPKVEHRFSLEARWTQVNPSQFPRSNELIVPVAAAADPYPAPVLTSAKLENGNYVLNWSLPTNPTGTPAGGYDIFIDGVDTNNTWRATGTSRTITGLDTKKAHTFMLEARWTQVNPSEFPRSNQLSVQAVSEPVVEPVPADYPAPVLNSAKLENGNYVLNWSLPNSSNGTPAGGYDIWIDGKDSQSTWRTTGTSRTITGLDAKVDHRFKVEARWNQTNPSQFPVSNEITANAAVGDTTAPKVALTSPASTTITSAQTLNIAATASDETGVSKVEFYNGTKLISTDTTSPYAANVALTAANNGTFSLCAIAYDQAGNSAKCPSVAVTVNITVLPNNYPAPVLTSAKLENGNYVLNWTLPATSNGTPEGGYDIFIDGVDTNDTWRATGTSRTITGLDTKKAHTFMLEARWTQVNPSEFPRSNQLSVQAVSEPVVEPVPANYPAPVLNTAKLENGNYVLNWTLPATSNGTPEGGYDIFIDGVDSNDTWRATGTSRTITGLSSSVEHTFMLEARWTQADPSEFPRSNTLSVAADSSAPAEPTDPVVISGPVKVFPGAEGFGTNSPAGRGGKIIRVTNLNDTGTGSLRAALEASGKRIVVFEVGGAIHLQSMLRISNPNCTVAGQTAPGKGIMIRNFGISVRTNDVLLQHLAIRVGDEVATAETQPDGIQILSPSYNVVVDHCSVSWGVDENADTWTDVRDVTFSNNIISECLRYSVHGKGSHSKGYLAGRRNQNISFIKNLLAHNESRNPIIYGKTTIQIANNVFYNAGSTSFSSIGDGWGDGPPKATVVGNVYKAGPGTTASAAIKIESSSPSGTAVYEAHNTYNKGSIRSGSTQYFVSSPPVSTSGVTIKTNASEIMNSVLTNAGARPAYRDAVDNRIANPSTGEVITGKGSWVDSVNGSGTRAPGGWPSYPTTYANFDAGTNPNGDDNGNGYTNIEEKLYQMAVKVEKK